MFSFLVVLLTFAFAGAHVLPASLSDRIVGGTDAPDGYAPHMVALIFGEPMSILLCGGSLVSPLHVLTAAHCIDVVLTWQQTLMRSFRGVIGSNRWNALGNAVDFTHHINHPDWNSWLVKNDIGMLFMAKDSKIEGSVRIVPLKFDYVGGEEPCYATGWGRVGDYPLGIPDQLQLLHVRTISSEACVKGIKEAEAKWGPAPPVDPALEICTLHSVNHGMCNGDSGSALILKSTGEQFGIVSWGFACALGAPDVFVRVSAFKDFILNIITRQ